MWSHRYFRLLLVFALLINFSGVHALTAEMSFADSKKISQQEQSNSTDETFSVGCAMHEHQDTSKKRTDRGELPKKAHVCGSTDCHCGCHMSAFVYVFGKIDAETHTVNWAAFQGQFMPSPEIGPNLRPPIVA